MRVKVSSKKPGELSSVDQLPTARIVEIIDKLSTRRIPPLGIASSFDQSNAINLTVFCTPTRLVDM